MHMKDIVDHIYSREIARLEDAVVSQATSKRLLNENESSDSTSKSYVSMHMNQEFYSITCSRHCSLH
jgi:hypothetical protein